VRIVTGSSVYDPTQSTITVPVAPLTAISGTQILTLQNNRFVDNSTNAYTLSFNNAPSIQAFSPFAPTDPYSTSVVGGSGYFDGTGDYLATPSSANLAMGSGDFTIECWVNTGLTSPRYIFDIRPSGSQAIGAYISSNSLYVNSGSTLDILASSAFVLNAWNHFAYVRSGSGSNNVSIFLNGVRVYQRTDATNYSTSPIVYVGADNSGSYSNGGYISGFRILKGTAQYSGATYTVTTTPPTAITNTQLLLNYTNAGIYDSAAKNDLETVGNAQVSTTQAKFGSTSMYFDGTGDWLQTQTTANANYNFTFGSGDFTIEMWVYPTNSNSVCLIQGQTDNSTISGGSFLLRYTGTTDFYSGGTAYTCTSATPTANQWSHIAYVRNGTSLKTYLNGTQAGTATLPSTTTAMNIGSTNNATRIGAYVDGTGAFTGYIDDLRITKGYARYTANFTPPTTAFPIQ